MADTPKKEVKDFTPRELEIMAKAWNCMFEEPKVNYDKLAEECGMTNPRSASNAWAAIKKKLTAIREAEGEDGAGTKATPSTKRGKKADANGDDDDVEGESPKKKARTPRKKKEKVEAEEKAASKAEGDGEESGAGGPVKNEDVDENL